MVYFRLFVLCFAAGLGFADVASSACCRSFMPFRPFARFRHSRPNVPLLADSAASVDATGPIQVRAQARADYMAVSGVRGHPPMAVGGPRVGGFEGVGWHSSPTLPHRRCPTCVTRGVPRGDAVARSAYGTFRVRIW